MQKIFDCHVHLWDLNKEKVSWIKGNERLERDFLFKNYKKCWEKCQQNYELLGLMYVEINSDDIKSENAFALHLQEKYAKDFDFKVCLADLENAKKMSAFREVLHVSQLGARRIFEDDFREILTKLESENLAFEACVRNEELAFLEQILSENKNLKVILNHFGSPNVDFINIDSKNTESKTLKNENVDFKDSKNLESKSTDFHCHNKNNYQKNHANNYEKNYQKNYEKNLATLSHYKNFFIKLSPPDNFSPSFLDDERLQKIHHIFKILKTYFGENRILFGSNYPVSLIAPQPWADVIAKSGVFKNLNLIFYENAKRIYK